MKRNRMIVILLCCLCILARSVPASAQFASSYNYYINLSRQAIEQNDLQSLLFYIEAAHSADPTKEEPFRLLENVQIFENNKQLLRGYLLQAIEALEREAYRSALFYFQLSLMVTPQDSLIKEYIDYVEKLIKGIKIDKRTLVDRVKREYKLEVPIEVDVKEAPPAPVKEVQQQPETRKEEFVAEQEIIEKRFEERTSRPPVMKVKEITRTLSAAQSRTMPEEAVVQDVIVLDEALWAKQPNTTFEVEYHKSIILEGRRIERWLILSEGFIDVGRIDRDRIQITSLRRGSTFLHVWDEKGRWTFNIKGVLPDVAYGDLRRSREDLWEEYVEPFKLVYSNNWNAFYVGSSPDDMHRQNLTFTQFIGLYGGTPYGNVYATANFFRFEESTENTGRSAGLTDGKIGPFRDFDIRGWDTYKRFSTLSLPGRYFRGGLIDAYAFHRRIKYSYLRGQDRANFITISEGVTDIRKSYLEGARLTLNPDGTSKYSINFARGWGEERPDTLKGKVFSFDTEHNYGPFTVEGELAYDEDQYGRLVRTKWEGEKQSLRINARDIEENFTTITSRPANQGEVGGNIIYDWESEGGVQFNTNLDLYRDRRIPNPDNPDDINMDFGAFVTFPLSETLHMSNSVFYEDTPQLISPRKNLRLNSTLSKTFRIIGDRALSTHIRGSYQRSRYSLTPQSEYDRYTASAGLRFPIFKRIAYFLQYDYSWVEVIEAGERNTPSVMRTGLSYSQTFNKNVTVRASVSFRDEEDTEGRFTFLSGTDMLRMNIGLSYRPVEDVEIFFDGGFRNVWSENNAQAAFNDADVRFGLRTSWDTLFAWNPKGVVNGYVFKDLNKNGIRDRGEPGVGDIRVRVGDKIAITRSNGYYTKEVRAEKVKVAIRGESIPAGYNLTSDSSKKVVIVHNKEISVDFGLSVRTEIFGVVFYDENGNGKHDAEEKTIPGAKITLDKEIVARTDFEGIYSFYDIVPGAYTLRIDLNSIPIEYIPKIKLSNDMVVSEGSSINFNIPLRKK